VSTVLRQPIAIGKAFSPGHITGVVKKGSLPSRHILSQGSEGAGFSIDRGVTTTVTLFDDCNSSYQISINGRCVEEAEVSQLVLQQYQKFIERPYYFKIEQDTEIPIGFGLGSSGAAALSLSYALNKSLKVGLSAVQAAQIAHCAEIVCRTGLGTVIAEYAGGLETRTRAGAPGIGIIRKIELKGHRVIIFCMAPISTKSVLCNNFDLTRSEWHPNDLLNNLKKVGDIRNFVNMSYDFVSKMGLTAGRCKGPISSLRSHGFDSSVALFGETVFTIVPEDRVQEAEQCLSGFNGQLFTCGIDNSGARVL
jgi:pantoate kinase